MRAEWLFLFLLSVSPKPLNLKFRVYLEEIGLSKVISTAR